jgi:hypothetical protein
VARQRIDIHAPDPTAAAIQSFDGVLRTALTLWAKADQRGDEMEKRRLAAVVSLAQGRRQAAELGPEALASYDTDTAPVRQAYGLGGIGMPKATTRQVPGPMVRSQVTFSESGAFAPSGPAPISAMTPGGLEPPQLVRQELPRQRTADVFSPGPPVTQTVPPDYAAAEDPLYRLAQRREEVRASEAGRKKRMDESLVSFRESRAEAEKGRAGREADKAKIQAADKFARTFSDFSPDVQGLARAASLEGRPFTAQMAQAIDAAVYGDQGYTPPREAREAVRRGRETEIGILGKAGPLAQLEALKLPEGKKLTDEAILDHAKKWKDATRQADSKLSQVEAARQGVKDAASQGDEALFKAQYDQYANLLGIEDLNADKAWLDVKAKGVNKLNEDMDKDVVRVARRRWEGLENQHRSLLVAMARTENDDIAGALRIQAGEVRTTADDARTAWEAAETKFRNEHGLKAFPLPGVKSGSGGTGGGGTGSGTTAPPATPPAAPPAAKGKAISKADYNKKVRDVMKQRGLTAQQAIEALDTEGWSIK